MEKKDLKSKIAELIGLGSQNQTEPIRLRLIVIWATILVASPLAIIPWRTFAVHEPFWWPWLHSTVLLVLLSLTLFYPALRPLRRYSLIIVIIFLLGYGGGWDWGLIPFIRSSDLWANWTIIAPKVLYEISLHLLRLTPAFVILGFLLISGRKRQSFFLVKGDIRATVGQSRLIGTKKPETWLRVALIFVTVFVAVTVVFLVGAYGFPIDAFTQNWYLIPLALLIAAMNGFNEEFTLRAVPLGELKPAVGSSPALVATAVYFGLGHYYGVPNGVIGVVLSMFLGWLLGKSMLETKGFFIAWMVHFLTDIPIFIFFIAGGI